MQWLAIVVLSIAACVTYGIVHDQITARVCVEYFTIGHPRVLPTDDPTILAIACLKELGHQKLDVISMGVIVALANLDDRASIQTLATALRDGDPVLHAQVLACAENCSQFQRFKSALELQRHLEDRAGEGTGDSVGDNSS